MNDIRIDDIDDDKSTTNTNSVITLDQMLISLEVIGSINVNDKLVWEDDNLTVNIQSVGPLRSIKRTINSQGRENSINNLQKLISKSIDYLENEESNIRLKNSLIKASHGLTNLAITYESDKKIVGSIKVLIQDILETINE